LAENELLTIQIGKDEGPTAKTTKWEYDFVVVSDMDQTNSVKFLQSRESRGCDFKVTTPLKDGEKLNIWVFRRSAK
jgi:hypothetical protein